MKFLIAASLLCLSMSSMAQKGKHKKGILFYSQITQDIEYGVIANSYQAGSHDVISMFDFENKSSTTLQAVNEFSSGDNEKTLLKDTKRMKPQIVDNKTFGDDLRVECGTYAGVSGNIVNFFKSNSDIQGLRADIVGDGGGTYSFIVVEVDTKNPMNSIFSPKADHGNYIVVDLNEVTCSNVDLRQKK